MPKLNLFNRSLILDRIKVDANGCWLWQQSTDSSGYGSVTANGKSYRAHRLALHLWTGFDLSSSLYVCHSCDIPLCCNPAHLWTGTQKDNMIDSARKGRHGDFKGSKHGKAKVDEDDVIFIRELYLSGDWNYQELSRILGTSRGHAMCIIKKRIWKHIP